MLLVFSTNNFTFYVHPLMLCLKFKRSFFPSTLSNRNNNYSPYKFKIVIHMQFHKFPTTCHFPKMLTNNIA